MRRTHVFRTTDGTPVARRDGDKLVKNARRSEHFLHTYGAWASDRAILEEAEALGLRYFEITDTENDTIYRAAIADFWRHGFDLPFDETQRALALKHWRRRRVGERPVEQPSLFGGAS